MSNIIDNPDFEETAEGWISQAQKSTNGHGKHTSREALTRKIKNLPDPQEREDMIFLIAAACAVIAALAIILI